MIEKILERLEAKKEEYLEAFRTHGDNERYGIACGFGDSIKIVQEVAKDGGWIPCSSGQMPEDMEEVLVWFEYFRYGNYNRLCQRHGLSYTFKGEWSGFINGESGWHQWRIIAWQPLPAEYREGE